MNTGQRSSNDLERFQQSMMDELLNNTLQMCLFSINPSKFPEAVLSMARADE
jgi:hypothetical protein